MEGRVESKSTVSEVMHKGVLMLKKSETVLSSAKFLKEHNIGAIGVSDENDNLIGMFSERDVLNRVVAMELDPSATSLDSVMTKEVITVPETQSVDEALVLMNDNKIRHLPVVDKNGKLVGMLGLRDLMQFVMDRAINDFLNS